MTMTFIANNQTWKIEEVPSEDINLLVDGTFRQGTTHYHSQTLYLLDNLTEDRKREVLGHELAHCFLYATQSYYEKENFSEEELCEFVGLYSGQITAIINIFFSRRKQNEV